MFVVIYHIVVHYSSLLPDCDPCIWISAIQMPTHQKQPLPCPHRSSRCYVRSMVPFIGSRWPLAASRARVQAVVVFFQRKSPGQVWQVWPYKGKGEDMPLMLLPILSDACFSTSVDSEIAVVGMAKMIFAADVHMSLCRFADLIYVSFSIQYICIISRINMCPSYAHRQITVYKYIYIYVHIAR